jgi:hypothetical protein
MIHAGDTIKIRDAGKGRVALTLSAEHAACAIREMEELTRAVAELAGAFAALPDAAEDAEARAAQVEVLTPLAARLLGGLDQGAAAELRSLGFALRTSLDWMERHRAKWEEDGRAMGVIE